MIYARYLWSLFGEGISKQNRTDELWVFDCVDLRVVSIKCRSLHSRILWTCTRSTSQRRYHLQTLLWLLLDSRCLLNISFHFLFHFLSNLLWSAHSLGSRDVCNMLRIALQHNCVVLHAFIINEIGFYSRTENCFRLLRTSFLSEDVFFLLTAANDDVLRFSGRSWHSNVMSQPHENWKWNRILCRVPSCWLV